MTERLSDPQFYLLMSVILALGIAGLLTVIVWPLEPRRVDRGGFSAPGGFPVFKETRNEDLALDRTPSALRGVLVSHRPAVLTLGSTPGLIVADRDGNEDLHNCSSAFALRASADASSEMPSGVSAIARRATADETRMAARPEVRRPPSVSISRHARFFRRAL